MKTISFYLFFSVLTLYGTGEVTLHKQQQDSSWLNRIDSKRSPLLLPKKKSLRALYSGVPKFWYKKLAFEGELPSLTDFSVEHLPSESTGISKVYYNEKKYFSSNELYYYSYLSEPNFNEDMLTAQFLFQFNSHSSCLLSLYIDGKLICKEYGALILSGDLLKGKVICVKVTGKKNYGLFSCFTYKNQVKVQLTPPSQLQSITSLTTKDLQEEKKPLRYNWSFPLSNKDLKFSWAINVHSKIQKIKINGLPYDLSSPLLEKTFLKEGLNTIEYTSDKVPKGMPNDLELIPYQENVYQTQLIGQKNSVIELSSFQSHCSLYVNNNYVGTHYPHSKYSLYGKGYFKEGTNSVRLVARSFKNNAELKSLKIKNTEKTPIQITWKKNGKDFSEFWGLYNHNSSNTLLSLKSTEEQKLSGRFHLENLADLHLSFSPLNQHSRYQWQQGDISHPKSITINGTTLVMNQSSVSIKDYIQRGFNTIQFSSLQQNLPVPVIIEAKNVSYASKRLKRAPWRSSSTRETSPTVIRPSSFQLGPFTLTLPKD